jgi:hypothetical protein
VQRERERERERERKVMRWGRWRMGAGWVITASSSLEPHCTASRGGEEGDEVSGKRWRVGAQPESSRRFKSPLFFPSAAFKFTHGHVLISIFL